MWKGESDYGQQPLNEALHPTAWSLRSCVAALPAAGELGRCVAARGLAVCMIYSEVGGNDFEGLTMTAALETPAWLIYERCVATFAVEEFGGIETTITSNAKILGEISGQERQIDVLVDTRWDARTDGRIIIDAKEHADKIDINDVEAFEGMMRDCRAHHGVIVCTNGHTEGAERRAEDAITITLLTFEQALKFDWAFKPCLGPCLTKSGRKRQRGMVLWGEYIPTGFNGLWVIVQTGKCDGCHSFHVWCWDCGVRFIVPNEHVVKCDCEEREWASVPESPESGHVGEPQSIWLMVREGGLPIALDRRPIR